VSYDDSSGRIKRRWVEDVVPAGQGKEAGVLKKVPAKSVGSVAPKLTLSTAFPSVGLKNPPPATDNSLERSRNAAWEALRVKNSALLAAARRKSGVSARLDAAQANRQANKIAEAN
jgi:hypothetical protein